MNAPVIPEQVQALVDSIKGIDWAQSLVDERKETSEWALMDYMDQQLASLPQADFRTNHIFTPIHGHPGLYIGCREIFMPANTLLTSAIHLFEHPFVISVGSVSVWTLEHGWEHLSAPYTGVTQPGTRRVLWVHTDTVWSIFVATTQTEPEKFVQEITYDHLKLGHLKEIPRDRKMESIT